LISQEPQCADGSQHAFPALSQRRGLGIRHSCIPRRIRGASIIGQHEKQVPAAYALAFFDASLRDDSRR